VHLLTCLGDILVAIPFGLLADRCGRRPILQLNLAGLLLSTTFVLVVMQWWSILPLRLTWLSAAMNFVGGGPTTTSSLFFMIIADVSDEAQRISYFSLLAIAGLAGQVIGAPLGRSRL
jgi:MFS family permease